MNLNANWAKKTRLLLPGYNWQQPESFKQLLQKLVAFESTTDQLDSFQSYK